VPPVDRPLPRFVAEPPREVEPHGRWRQRLEELFHAACQQIEGQEQVGAPGEVRWFPERTYASRVFVPAAAETQSGNELFGYVSFSSPEDSPEPADFLARADYTDDTLAKNPDWKLDLNDDVIARWRGSGEAGGDLTLVWGTSLVLGGAVVTAELDGETLDQCSVPDNGRFTLAALDAVTGFGDDLYLEVKLWDRQGNLLATESLYEEESEDS
jgi:hypothetical protein